MVTAVIHFAFLAGVGIAAMAECRWIARRSRLLGGIVGLGLAIRLIVGTVLFLISHFDLGILKGLHTGGGFWVLASDAPMYYAHAASAAVGNVVYPNLPAPLYLAALALWLRATGTSMLSAVLFNAVCYLVTVAAIVTAPGWRDRRLASVWLPVVVAAFSFSPVLLLTSTQVLKESFFTMLVVIACRAGFELFERCTSMLSGRVSAAAAALGIAAGAIGVVAGVRSYYSLLLCFSFGVGLATVVCLGGATKTRVFLALYSVAAFGVLWVAFMIGAGSSYPYYGSLIARTTGVNIPVLASSSSSARYVPQSLAGEVKVHRNQFIRGGGATNLFAWPPMGRAEGGSGASEPGPAEAVDDLVVGLLATFVPISVLRAASIVSFHGGRGFLFVADADTIFIDATLLVLGALMIRHRSSVLADLPAAAFVAALVIIATPLLAYVVTNFGTLFRLRLLFAVPAWLVPLALRMRAAGLAPAEAVHVVSRVPLE